MRRFLTFLTLTLLSISVYAQRYNKYESSYYYKQAMEYLDKEDGASALEALKKEISEHKDNGYAYLWAAAIHLSNEEYGDALVSADNAIKYIPKKDKEYKAFAYYKRAGVYRALDDTIKALADYSTAISIDPTDYKFYSERAQILYEEGLYDQADRDYVAIKSLDEHNSMAYMGMGRNKIARGEYRQAIDDFDYVIALYPDYSSGYSFRAEAKMKVHEYSDAASDIVKALSINRDDKAFYLMNCLADSSFTHICTKLKSYAVTEPNSEYWPYCLGVIYESTRKYEEAIDYYMKSAKLDSDDVVYSRISNCYEEMGDWELAMEYIDKAIEIDPTYFVYPLSKADIYYKSGDIKSGVTVLDSFIESHPDYYYGYYRRGWFKDNLNDIDGAIADYTTSIELNPDYSYAYMSRGKMHLLKGEDELAHKDFEETVKRDTVPEKGNATEYALFYLGRVDEAKAWMQKIIDADKDDSGVYYDAACLYALMGDIDSSIAYLKTSLDKGYKGLHHIQTDNDLDNIRNDSRYQELISRYSAVKEASMADSTKVSYVEKISEIPFTRSGGVTKVKCEINGLPLHFVFDTGAAEVTISRIEATFMFKNDYLTAADVVGKARYMDANGDISIGTVINLRKVTFAGLELENVRASVVDSGNAPLLLGQSVLSRLGKVEIDYEKSVLRITVKEKVNN